MKPFEVELIKSYLSLSLSISLNVYQHFSDQRQIFFFGTERSRILHMVTLDQVAKKQGQRKTNKFFSGTTLQTWPFIRSYIKADGITQSWVSHSILKEQIRLSILIGAFCFIKITFYIYKYLCIDLYWSFSLSRKQNFLMIRLVFNCISFFKCILDFIITIFILFIFWNF